MRERFRSPAPAAFASQYCRGGRTYRRVGYLPIRKSVTTVDWHGFVTGDGFKITLAVLFVIGLLSVMRRRPGR